MLLNMKLARVKKGFTQKELATRTKISMLTINQIESGKRNIDLVGYGTLKKISNVLDISIEELIKTDQSDTINNI